MAVKTDGWIVCSFQSLATAGSVADLGGGPGHVGLVLLVDHARRPVLRHEGGDVGGGVADPGVRVGQQVVLQCSGYLVCR